MTRDALLAFLSFETPGYLLALAAVPLIILLSFRSLAGLGPIRRWLAIALRCAVIVCMALALAGAQRVRTTDALSVVFIADRSSSVPRPEQQREFDFVQAAALGLRPVKDRLGVVAFDGQSMVEQLPMGRLEIKDLSAAIDPDKTDLSAALRMSLALFTDQAARRVVVLSDGAENVGDALQEADRYAAAGVPIDVVPVRYKHGDEVVFERLSAPPTATAEETINLRMTLRSQRRVSGKILLEHNEQLVDLAPRDPGSSGYPVTLDPGPNALQIPVPLRAAGAHRFRASFEPDDARLDTITANNEGRAFTIVTGQGRILILAQPGEQQQRELESAALLAQALERERLDCDVRLVGERPIDQVGLLEYSLVILSNVAAGELREDERRALAVYVRDLGGGLIMVGGEDSFGAGGWMDTPVEEIMPVSFDVKAKKQIPKGALVLVMHACEIPQGNFIGERAAVAAVRTLSSRDLVGVLSYKWQGAEQKYWDVPFQQVGDKSRILNLIKQMSMGDMPDLDPLMRLGVDELLKRSDAAARHMIVVSDFDPAPPRDDLLKKMKENKITCSTVCIGYGAHVDEGRAKWLADATGGTAHLVRDNSKVPQIFIKESRIVRRSLINEEPFTPLLADSMSTLVEGLQGQGVPELGGHVLTTAKPLAQIPLIRKTNEGDDPILAHWQVGLGRTVAFTSGMWNSWGVDWAAWPGFSKLWGQIARWASRQSPAAAFDVSTSVEGGRGKIRVDALDKGASAIDFMKIEGALVNPDSETQPLRLTQRGPGQYEAEFDARDAGSYVVNLAYRMGQGADAVAGTLQTGLSVAFSAEYRELETNEALLRALADRTGGRELSREQAAASFDPAALPPAATRQSIWEDLTKLMLLLFLIDVAVRRIAINPIELARRARRLVAELARGGRAAEGSEAVLSTLKGARARAREGVGPGGEGGPAPDPQARFQGGEASRSTEELSKALGGASELDAPVVARPTRKPPPQNEADFTARLLRAKRKALDELKDDEPGKNG